MRNPHERHHGNSPWDGAPSWAIELGIGVSLILEGKTQMAIDTTKILADITAQTTVLQSLVTFVQATTASNADQAKQIDDLKAALAAASVSDPAVQAAVDAMAATVESNTALAAGVMPAATANTPAA